jgi:hypothetical protein
LRASPPPSGESRTNPGSRGPVWQCATFFSPTVAGVVFNHPSIRYHDEFQAVTPIGKSDRGWPLFCIQVSK